MGSAGIWKNPPSEKWKLKRWLFAAVAIFYGPRLEGNCGGSFGQAIQLNFPVT